MNPFHTRLLYQNSSIVPWRESGCLKGSISEIFSWEKARWWTVPIGIWKSGVQVSSDDNCITDRPPTVCRWFVRWRDRVQLDGMSRPQGDLKKIFSLFTCESCLTDGSFKLRNTWEIGELVFFFKSNESYVCTYLDLLSSSRYLLHPPPPPHTINPLLR